ncbi:RNA polymerase sigma factor [Arenibaculum pallidiluteum]|uniref:RNA polymerase sigma factor n=1 Tax=Arenibaculum pallidiluteum TaxID=2812559 RepID=UPI001A97994F|nr:RNA polymerase sigma factor [Arenibaculum pallidiluteum]
MGHRGPSGLIISFQEYYGDLLRFLARRTGNRQWAADVAQETYLRLASLQEATPEVGDARAYIFRVAGNLAIDSMRKEARLAARYAEEDAAIHVADPSPLPETILLARERLALLEEALKELPPNARQALLMSRVDGLSFAQIAAELGVSESMVAKYIAQALRACRDRLNQER